MSLLTTIIEFSLSIDGPLITINGPVIPIFLFLAPTFLSGYLSGRLASYSHRLRRRAELEGGSER